MIVSSHPGALISYNLPSEEGLPQGSKGIVVALPGEFGIYQPVNQRKIVTDVQSYVLQTSVEIVPSEDPKQPFLIKGGFGGRSRSKRDSPVALQISFEIHPCAFVKMAHERHAQCSWPDEEILQIDDDSGQWKFDVATGRLIGATLYGDSKDDPIAQIRFQPGALDAKRAAAVNACQEVANEYPSDGRDLYWIAHFVLADEQLNRLTSFPLPNTAERRALLKIIDKALLPVWQSNDETPSSQSEENFSTVLYEEDTPFSNHVVNQARFITGWATGLSFVEIVFPDDTWPRLMLSEWIWSQFGKTEFANERVNEFIRENRLGPTGLTLLASLSSSPTLARLYALSTFQRKDVEQFQEEFRFLWDGDSAIKQRAEEFVTIIRELEESDFDTLETCLNTQNVAYFAAGLRVIRTQQGPREEVLPAALAAVWSSGFRERLQATQSTLFHAK